MSGNILGLGTDIIEIERIRQSLKAHPERFLAKLFTQKEQDYCLQHQDPAPQVAARFAAKESIAKALGCGFGDKLSWLDIEILNDPAGKPNATLTSSHFPNAKFHISLAHSKDYATAVAIWVS